MLYLKYSPGDSKLPDEWRMIFSLILYAKRIENVIDSTNYNHLGGYYRPMDDAANDLTQGQRIPLQGRNYYATLSYQW